MLVEPPIAKVPPVPVEPPVAEVPPVLVEPPVAKVPPVLVVPPVPELPPVAVLPPDPLPPVELVPPLPPAPPDAMGALFDELLQPPRATTASVAIAMILVRVSIDCSMAKSSSFDHISPQLIRGPMRRRFVETGSEN